MTENPWARKHPGRSRKKIKSLSPGSARSLTPSTSARRSSGSSKRSTTASDPEEIRRRLFAAGWKPSMVGLPITDRTILRLFDELHEALVNKTLRRIKVIEREQHS